MSFRRYFFVFAVAFLSCACSPKIVEHVRTEIEYRDRIVHDTATVEIPTIIEKNVTRDTVSHLENKYAKSDASVSAGLLSHSLETNPQIIRIPVEVHVTDTLWKESEVITEVKEVEKQLTWWQRVRLDSFWPMLALIVGLLLWTFRKPLLALFKIVI